MKVVVCAKVFQGELGPFDQCAIEEALKLDGADVTVVTMGPESAIPTLRRVSRLGVKRVILLTDKCLVGSDSLATSYALSELIKTLSPDLVITGRQSVDGDTAQIGPCVSSLLGYNLAAYVMKLEVKGNTIECETRYGKEELNLPAVVTVERINVLRFPRIGSKPIQVEVLSADDLKLDKSKVGANGSPTKVLQSFECALGVRKCKYVSSDSLDEIIREALNDTKEEQSEEKIQVEKLKNVTVIGQAVYEKASEIAENVKVIEEKDPNKIAELVKFDEVVLWNSEFWDRKTAPFVAAKLQTGLCADVTRLDTLNGRIVMYRPAFGGRLTAKIVCSTNPQMATVRCSKAKSGDVIFAFGKGALGNIDKYKAIAEKYGAEICCSRPMVDNGTFPYECQVGLTGKNVAPKVYVAVGISGAVQHTAGYEGAKIVIAINPDRDARIFEYADYGIVEEC